MGKKESNTHSLPNWWASLEEIGLPGVTHKCNEELQGGFNEGLLFYKGSMPK